MKMNKFILLSSLLLSSSIYSNEALAQIDDNEINNNVNSGGANLATSLNRLGCYLGHYQLSPPTTATETTPSENSNGTTPTDGQTTPTLANTNSDCDVIPTPAAKNSVTQLALNSYYSIVNLIGNWSVPIIPNNNGSSNNTNSENNNPTLWANNNQKITSPYADFVNENANLIFQNYSTNPVASLISDGSTSNANTNDNSGISAYLPLDNTPLLNTPTSQMIYNFLTLGNGTSASSCHVSGNDDQGQAISLAITPPPQGCYTVPYVLSQIVSSGSDSNLPAKYSNLISQTNNLPLTATLNADTFINPLIYNQDNSANTDTSEIYGLVGKSQAAQANNFVRYVTGQASPFNLAKEATYNNMISTTNKKTLAANKAAIAKYIANLRSYVAKMSVGTSNMYYLLGKRMSPAPNVPSQAATEFSMATSRLLDPKNPGKPTSWMKHIQNATPADMQRETLYLLAELNYQMYLSRRDQERMLMTISTLQLEQLETTKDAVTLQTPSNQSQSVAQESLKATGYGTSTGN